MLVYDLEQKGDLPIYEYLYQRIRDDILVGTIAEGEKLPSKREFARTHAIAVITVENAYAQLQIEGYIYAKEKSGYYVNYGIVGAKNYMHNNSQHIWEIDGDIDNKKHINVEKGKYHNEGNDKISNSDNALNKIIDNELNIITDKDLIKKTDKNSKITDKDLIKKTDKEANKKIDIDFTSNHTSAQSFPMATWAKITRKVLNEQSHKFSEKPQLCGIVELQNAIANYLIKAKGIKANPENIVVGPGTEYLHHLVLQIIGHNRLVAVEDPGYKKVGLLYESNGLRCLHIPVDEQGLIVDSLKQCNASLVHISPAHHFPTGCVMSINRRHQILEWAENKNAYIIEDDYDSEIRFDGRPIPPLAALDHQHVIYMNTFTKTLTPSIRIAYMLLPDELLNRMMQKIGFYSGAVSSMEQYTLAVFLQEGFYDRHINRMRNFYRIQRKKILDEISNSAVNEWIEIQEENAGLHFIMSVKRKIDDEEFQKYLLERGIKILPVSYFCYNNVEKYRNKFIINYADVSDDSLRYAIEQIGIAIEKTLI